jgi:hypothetical protein
MTGGSGFIIVFKDVSRGRFDPADTYFNNFYFVESIRPEKAEAFIYPTREVAQAIADGLFEDKTVLWYIEKFVRLPVVMEHAPAVGC